jgi:hypothetical protein
LEANLCCHASSPSVVMPCPPSVVMPTHPVVILAKAGISLHGNILGRNGLLLSQE